MSKSTKDIIVYQAISKNGSNKRMALHPFENFNLNPNKNTWNFRVVWENNNKWHESCGCWDYLEDTNASEFHNGTIDEALQWLLDDEDESEL